MFLYIALQMNFANRGTTDFPPVERMTPIISVYWSLVLHPVLCLLRSPDCLYISVLQIPFELVTTSYWFSH